MYELGYRRVEINSLLMKDVYLIFLGRGNKFNNDQVLLRNVSVIVSDVFSQVMGGKSIRNDLLQMWPIVGDPAVNGGSEMTREEMKAILKRHKERLNGK